MKVLVINCGSSSLKYQLIDAQTEKALQELTTLALTGLTEPQTIYISHGDCHEDACYVAKQMEKSEFVKKIIMQPLDPVSACHTGPNSIGIFFV